MNETPFRPDLSDKSRCGSVHWSLPVQCVLKRTHRENWHEAWHPESGNRMRYRYPIRTTQELRHGEWTTLYEPPITSLPAAVAAQGALPVPVGDRPQPLAELEQVSAEIARFGIYGAAVPATKALVKRADELVTEKATLLAEVERLKAELAEQTRYAAALEADLCTCEPLCESGEYLHAADCPVAEVQMRMDGCPGFEGNPVAPDLCAGCGESRRWHEEAAS
jgi:hypothetical protein